MCSVSKVYRQLMFALVWLTSGSIVFGVCFTLDYALCDYRCFSLSVRYTVTYPSFCFRWVRLRNAGVTCTTTYCGSLVVINVYLEVIKFSSRQGSDL